MSVRTHPSERWVRGFVGETAVVDSRDPLLFWEETLPVPYYAYRWADLRRELLVPATVAPPREPFFFLPQGPVTEWYDIVVGERTLPHAAWVRDDPALADRVIITWRPGALRWFEEDELVRGHPRDPFKRVDALPSSRHVVVSLDGQVLAETRHPVLLFETSLPTRYYFPREDVDLGALTATRNRSHCPYKGFADGYWSVTGHDGAENIAWSYSDPHPAVGGIKDRVAFYNEVVDITVDGVLQQRPDSPFARREHRPGASS